jgi:hypothetical protein
MVWPFGRKKRKADVKVVVSQMSPDYELWQRQWKEREDFEKSSAGKIIKRHFKYTEQLQMAPASRQESIAQEMVGFAGDAAKAYRAQEELWARHARESKERRPYEVRMPSHLGFQRLAINYERDKRFEDAIAVCVEAKRQGWNGDWDKRIERCQTKKRKAQS